MKEGNASRLSEVLQGSLLVDLLDEVMPGLVYVYDLAERRNVYTNRSLAELLGYSRQEVAALGEQLMPTILHPDDFERATAHHAGMPAVKDGQIVEIEYRVKDAAGAWHWLHSWETVLARDAQGAACRTLGIAQDVTRRVQIEEELRESRHQVSESEQRWRSIAENPFDFVIVIDRDYKFVYVNFVAPGQRREDLLGKKTPLDFATGEDHTG